MNKPLCITFAVVGVATLEALRLFVGAEPPAAGSAVRTPFPHAAHARLFPTCTACHAGVADDDTARVYTVGPRDCAQCHDGRARSLVRWSPPPARPTNLHFSHRGHAMASIACAACHSSTAGAERMAVSMPGPDRCLQCHGETPHFDPATRCDVCHAPLAAAPQVPV